MTDPLPFPARLALSDEVVRIAAVLEGAGHAAWCVGGALRDHLLGDPQQDVDLATSATPEQVQALFRRTVPVGVKHGTVGVVDRDDRLHEITTFRRDVRTDGRHAEVAFGVSLEEDLARRDFTINAIAYHPLRHEWQDPFDGARDLAAGIVRAVGDPAERFREDYLRILRALRFASRFGFAIESGTWLGMRAGTAGLAGLSAERVRDEWFKGLASARSVGALVRLWHASGAAAVVLPELRAEPALADLDSPPRDPVLLTALLVEDPARVLQRLRASTAQMGRAARFTASPEAPAGSTPAEVRRWLHVTGEAADDLLAAHRRRHGAEAPWAEAVRGIRARGEAVNRSGLAVHGGDLAAAGIRPGPGMGQILEQLLGDVLEDPTRNEPGWLIARARELA